VQPERSISLAALTVLELSPTEMVQVAARCGYSHVGLRPIAATATERHFPLLADAALRRETRAKLDDLGIGVLDIEILRLKPDTIVADFEAALACGAEVGARFALLAGNDPDLARAADTMGALCELARLYRIIPHLEFMPWTHVPNMETALAVANGCGSSNAGLLVDAFHLNRSGGRVTDIPAQDPRFAYVQLCDIGGPIPADMDAILHEGRAERLYPGEGDCDLAGLLQRLPAGVPISLEIPRDTLRAQGVSAEERARSAIAATRGLLTVNYKRPLQ
jgi:sugar phosphate isomerase/epimerase